MKKHALFLFCLTASIFSFYFVSCNSLEDETPPESVTDLSLLAKSESLFLSWTNPEDEDFYGTEIYITSADKTYVNSFIAGAQESSYLIEDLVNGVKYCVTLYAIDEDGNRSTPVSQDFTPTNAYGPAQVKNAVLSFNEDKAFLAWTNPKDSAFAGTVLSVSVDGTLAETFNLDKDAVKFCKENLLAGKKYTFSFTTYDNKSLSSQPYLIEGNAPCQSEGLEFTLSSDGTYYIVSAFTGDPTNTRHATPEEELQVPKEDEITLNIFSTHKGLPVREIGERVFENCHRITKVNLPSSLKIIGRNAFQGCTGLKGIQLPEGLKNIKEGAFWNCSKLEWILIPSSVEQIAFGATLGDRNISKIFYTGSQEQWKSLLLNVKDGNPAISASLSNQAVSCVFDYDSSIPVEFSAPQVIKNILVEPGNSHVILSWTNPSDADFDGTYISSKPADGSLSEEVFVPSDKNRYVALNLTNGTSYTFFLSAVDKSGNRSASRMSTKVTAGEVEKSLQGFNYVVARNGSEIIITGRSQSSENGEELLLIPQTIAGLPVTEIADNAFAGEDFIKSVILPEGIKTVASNAFKGCTKITDVYIAGHADDALHYKGLALLKALVHGEFVYDADDLTPPSEISVYKILSGNRKLVVVIEGPKDSDYFETVLSVNKENVVVSSYGKNIFVLTGLTNGEEIEFTLKTKDLYGNTSEGIVLSASARDIPFSASTESGFAAQLLQGEIYGGTSYVLTGFDFMKSSSMNAEKIELPSEINGVPVTHVEKNALNGFKKIKNLVISENIVDINPEVFADVCINKFTLSPGNAVFSLNADGTILYRNNYLKKSLVRVSQSVSGELDFTASSIKEIEPYAMSGCSLLTSVIVGENTVSLGQNCMADCTSLKHVVISRSVEKIGDHAFDGCKDLLCIRYVGSADMWNKIDVNLNENQILNCEKNLYFEADKQRK